jgi:plastocyanin
MPARPAVFAAASVAVVVLLGACSNTQSPVNRRPHPGTATASAVGTVQQITLEVGAEDRFAPSTFVVHPGMVRVVLKYVGTGAPHNFQVVAFPADFVPLTSDGQTKAATFVAPSPGTYKFVCTIHERQGMTGTMIVAKS